jgi:protein tyrosine phosphatase (PTP) superfamily phosphohydrolase (DUF442 family)
MRHGIGNALRIYRRPRPLLPVLVLLLALLAPGGTRAEALLSFASDGCSRFPNGTPQSPERWRHCCLEHDLAYWRGGSYDERLAADRELEACVAAGGEAQVGAVMFQGVRLGGSPWWPTPYRWGYGWPYPRGYQPLSAGEQALVRAALAPAGRPAAAAGWPEAAQAIPAAEVGNWFRVSARLYRSAQPSAAGFREVAARGITTVLNLRAFHTDDREAAGSGLALQRVPMHAFSLGEEELVRALRVIREAPGPVLVHCLHGADRTGTVVALYRIVEQGWSREAAIAEMTEGGFGYHPIFPNLLDCLRQADIARIRAALDRPLAAATDRPAR